jgi:hypothetical protein
VPVQCKRTCLVLDTLFGQTETSNSKCESSRSWYIFIRLASILLELAAIAVSALRSAVEPKEVSKEEQSQSVQHSSVLVVGVLRDSDSPTICSSWYSIFCCLRKA